MIERVLEREKEFRESLSKRNQKLWQVFLFLAKFTVLAAPLYLLIWSNWNPLWLRQLNAAASSGLLNVLGVDSSSSGVFILTSELSVNVSVDSTGWKSVLALTGLMLATPGTVAGVRKKIYGILSGVIFVMAGNIARLVSMVYMVEVWGVSYQLVHTFLWRWGLTFLVLGFWISWLNWDYMRDWIYKYQASDM
ncbi:MAG: exosortase/archaeosortase family protein [Candidatus Nanohaloarchaea archaeon]|nr:exosortase/archaeosortase family protein [Candidatus Nanohaloarchaea archaeon]